VKIFCLGIFFQCCFLCIK